MIQYGYVTLFAAAFPLGTAFNYIFLFFERRSDAYKIETLCRRPLPRECSDIGIWDDLMKLIGFMSIFTNIFLISFGTYHSPTPLQPPASCSNFEYFIRVEHVLIFTIIAIRMTFSSMPKWVGVFLQRYEHRERTALLSSLSSAQ